MRAIHRPARVSALAFVAALGATESAAATEYFVDVDSTGGSCSDSAAGTAESAPWCTLAKATASVQAGDVVTLRGGTYTEELRPQSAGTETERITFRAYPGETPVLTLPAGNTGYAIDIRYQSYITLEGIHAEGVRRYLLVRGSNHVWVHDCVFDGAINSPPEGWYVGIVIHESSQHTWLRGNVIGGVGYSTDQDIGGTINVGSWENADDYSHYNLIENNVLFHGGHHVMEMASSYNVVRNNVFYNNPWMSCAQAGGLCGNRDIGLSGNYSNVVRNVFDGNIIAHSGVPADGNSAACMSLRATHTIVRRNVFHNCDGMGIEAGSYTHDPPYEPDPSHSRIYQNTFFHNGYSLLPGVEDWKGTGLTIAHHGTGPDVVDVAVKNNLFHDDRTDAIVYYYVDEGSQVAAANWEHAGDPRFVDADGPPVPTDPTVFDLRLQADSPCIDVGAFVTTAAGAGQGTSLPVVDAGYFTDGFGVVDGDTIQLEGQTDRYRVTAVDYDTNVLTLATAATWSDGQGVGLPYVGSAPDIGAYEHGSEGGGGAGTGNAGASGSGNSGAVGATGGGSAAAGGTAASGGAPIGASPVTGEDEGGCGCRLLRTSRSVGAQGAGIVALAALLASRRRARRASGRIAAGGSNRPRARLHRDDEDERNEQG